MSGSVLPVMLALASLAGVPHGGGSLQGLYWKVKTPRKRARPEKKAARKAQDSARKANRRKK